MDSAQIEAAAQLGLSAPTPNPYAAALAALYQLSDPTEIPTPAEIHAAWDRVAARQEEDRRARLETAITQARSPSRRKRLREQLRTPISAPRVALPGRSDGEVLVLAESYQVDTPTEFFAARHDAYLRAQRQRTPIPYLVYRRGEPMTIELRISPAPQLPTRLKGKRGAPMKLSDERVKQDLENYPGSDLPSRAQRLGVSVRTLRTAIRRQSLS